MNMTEWLQQCRSWTPEDDALFNEGRDSGTAMNRLTGLPLVPEDLVSRIMELQERNEPKPPPPHEDS